MAKEVFQSLWIGEKLSVMEQLSIRSFLAQGYEFHLYTYHDLEGIPPGATVFSGEHILPADKIFRCQKGYGIGSYAGFSNGFRYKLLLERGGWWTDLDCVCMRPIDLPDEHIAGKERARDGGFLINPALMKAPAGSPLMEYCWEAFQKIDPGEMLHGQSGSRLMTEAVERMSGLARILEAEAFHPIDFWQVWQFITSGQIPADCYSIHLWQSCWEHGHLDCDAHYRYFCIYEQLKRRYGVYSPRGVAKGPGYEVRARHWWRELKQGLRRAA